MIRILLLLFSILLLTKIHATDLFSSTVYLRDNH